MTIRDRKEGGAARAVKVLTSDDLKENGGRYTISGKIAIPVTVDEANRKITGGPIGEAVYIVTDAEIAAGDFKVGGSSSLTVVDSSVLVPARSPAHGFQATPVYVVSGTLGGAPEGQATDSDGTPLLFDDGEPYIFTELPNLDPIISTETSPAEDFLHMWDSAANGAKKILIRDYGAAISRIQYAHFKMYRNASYNPSDNVWFKVPWTTTEYDSHSGVSLANNRYTIPTGQGGVWMFYASLALRPWAYTRIRLYKNGSGAGLNWGSDTRATQNGPEAQDNTVVPFLETVAEGDQMEIYAYHHQLQNIDASAVHTYFSGMKIGPS